MAVGGRRDGFEARSGSCEVVNCPRCDGTLGIERDEFGVDIVCVQGSHRWYEARVVRGQRVAIEDDPMRHLPRVSKAHRGEPTSDQAA